MYSSIIYMGLSHTQQGCFVCSLGDLRFCNAPCIFICSMFLLHAFTVQCPMWSANYVYVTPNRLAVCLSVRLSVSICQPVRLSFRLSVYLSASSSIFRLSVYLSACLSICQPVRLSVSLCV